MPDIGTLRTMLEAIGRAVKPPGSYTYSAGGMLPAQWAPQTAVSQAARKYFTPDEQWALQTFTKQHPLDVQSQPQPRGADDSFYENRQMGLRESYPREQAPAAAHEMTHYLNERILAGLPSGTIDRLMETLNTMIARDPQFAKTLAEQHSAIKDRFASGSVQKETDAPEEKGQTVTIPEVLDEYIAMLVEGNRVPPNPKMRDILSSGALYLREGP